MDGKQERTVEGKGYVKVHGKVSTSRPWPIIASIIFGNPFCMSVIENNGFKNWNNGNEKLKLMIMQCSKVHFKQLLHF